MATKKKIRYSGDLLRHPLRVCAVAVFLLALICHSVKADEPDSSFSLKIENFLVNLAVEDVPLNKILKAISGKTGLKLRSVEQATELISCHFTGITLDESLERLLVNWNYALLYKKDSHGRTVPGTLWIVNRNARGLSGDGSGLHRLVSIDEKGDFAQPPQDHLKKFKQKDFVAVFSDRKKILQTISVKIQPLADDGNGIKITRLSSKSPLKQLGLNEGDLVTDVNGQPVDSAAGFIRALATPPEGTSPIIRIERRNDKEIDPIYIELH